MSQSSGNSTNPYGIHSMEEYLNINIIYVRFSFLAVTITYLPSCLPALLAAYFMQEQLSVDIVTWKGFGQTFLYIQLVMNTCKV